MNPQSAPEATPVPIQDIVGPVAFFPYPLWLVALVALGILALLALAGWFFFFRHRSVAQLSPADRAQAWLAKLRSEVATTEPYAFSIMVSDVLREYLRDGRGLNATTQTSREFLDAVRERRVFNEEESAALAAFLERADLIKFARVHATADDSAALLDQAERLVRGGQGMPATMEAGAK
jgi:hypothetical protein